MKTYTIKVGPGERFEFAAVGDYVRVKKSAVELVIENPNANGSVKIEAEQGDDFELDSFERLTVSHSDAATQEIKLLISKGKKSNTSPVSAVVSVSNIKKQRGPIHGNQYSVTDSATVLLRGANMERSYLLIQNNDPVSVLRLRVDSISPTATSGLRLQPGDSIEFASVAPVDSVYARMESPAGSASNVEVWEG